MPTKIDEYEAWLGEHTLTGAIKMSVWRCYCDYCERLLEFSIRQGEPDAYRIHLAPSLTRRSGDTRICPYCRAA